MYGSGLQGFGVQGLQLSLGFIYSLLATTCACTFQCSSLGDNMAQIFAGFPAVGFKCTDI